MQALEPDVLTGATPPPQVITHQAGYAPTVTVKDLHRLAPDAVFTVRTHGTRPTL
jgi:hypothetical protein